MAGDGQYYKYNIRYCFFFNKCPIFATNGTKDVVNLSFIAVFSFNIIGWSIIKPKQKTIVKKWCNIAHFSETLNLYRTTLWLIRCLDVMLPSQTKHLWKCHNWATANKNIGHRLNGLGKLIHCDKKSKDQYRAKIALQKYFSSGHIYIKYLLNELDR